MEQNHWALPSAVIAAAGRDINLLWVKREVPFMERELKAWKSIIPWIWAVHSTEICGTSTRCRDCLDRTQTHDTHQGFTELLFVGTHLRTAASEAVVKDVIVVPVTKDFVKKCRMPSRCKWRDNWRLTRSIHIAQPGFKLTVSWRINFLPLPHKVLEWQVCATMPGWVLWNHFFLP